MPIRNYIILLFLTIGYFCYQAIPEPPPPPSLVKRLRGTYELKLVDKWNGKNGWMTLRAPGGWSITTYFNGYCNLRKPMGSTVKVTVDQYIMSNGTAPMYIAEGNSYVEGYFCQ